MRSIMALAEGVIVNSIEAASNNVLCYGALVFVLITQATLLVIITLMTERPVNVDGIGRTTEDGENSAPTDVCLV